jgi:hypothetical protein
MIKLCNVNNNGCFKVGDGGDDDDDDDEDDDYGEDDGYFKVMMI